MKKRETILLLGAGTQALAVVKSLHENGYRLEVLTNEKGNYADFSKYVTKSFLYSGSIEGQNFLDYFTKLVEIENVQITIPMGDIYVEFLSKNKQMLQRIVKYIVPDYDYFLQGYDKNKLMALCKKKGYPHPQTLDLSQSVNLSDEMLMNFHYPAMLKPNCTTGGRGMTRVDRYEELKEKYPILHDTYGEYHLQRYVPDGGKQIKIQLCVDRDGHLLNSSVLHKVRWYPVKGGASSCSVTIENNKLVSICHQILKDIHWEGFADFDLIEDPASKEFLIMELNPRLPACVGAAVRGGIDWGQIIVDQILGKEQKHYVYKKGVVLRHLGFDILWFLKSQNRFKTNPSWFKFFGKNVFYQDYQWADPIPFWIGTLHNIKKLMTPSFRRQKQGA